MTQSSHRAWGKHPLGLIVLISLLLTLLLTACSTDSGEAPPPTPTPTTEWQSRDIGAPPVDGRIDINETTETIVIEGSGEIWYRADSFHFAYRPLKGDGSVITRVTALDQTQLGGKVGIMMRESLDEGAGNVMLFMTDSPVYDFRGAILQVRSESDGVTNNQRFRNDLTPPHWLRLTRTGNIFEASTSGDGNTWLLLDSTTLAFPEQIYVGLAVASGSEAERAITASFVSSRVEEVNPDPGPDPDPGPEPDPDPNPGPVISVSFTADNSTFLNPERGFFDYVDITDGRGLTTLRNRGLTLGQQTIRLDNYRYQPLPAAFIERLENSLEEVRRNGVKLILRFAYNAGGVDAPLSTILQHINQLQPTLHAYADVIAMLDAGFIGAWGEWHSSTYGNTTAQARQQVHSALLAAVPNSRMIHLRSPWHRRTVLGPEILQPSDAFSSSAQARTALKNDCFLTDATDTGTYRSDPAGMAEDRAYVADITRLTAMRGETCSAVGLVERNSCPTALRELDEFNWDSIAISFWAPIIDKWRSEGCFDEINRRLGYRLRLLQATATREVTPGDTLSVTLQMTNDGFGKVYNPRPLEIILRNTSTGAEVSLLAAQDARTLLPLSGETRNIPLNIRVPINIPIGTYAVLLNLPDSSPRLHGRPEYSIRLANQSVWETSTGYNSLLMNITIR